MYQIGCGKTEITAFEYNRGMLGYAQFNNVVKGVATPLYARAFVFENPSDGQKICIVNGEICFYTIIIKHKVLAELQTNYPEWGYTDDNLMLVAQHTHSGPGGISHYLCYNLSTPGFQPNIVEKIVAGTVKSIVLAEQNKQDARIFYKTGKFPKSVKVAFNRSLVAYNTNPEITQKLSEKEAHLALDREMKLLRFEGQDGQTLGSYNWFGVHTTSISNDNTLVCHDNKGYAAEYLEKNISKKTGNTNFIAAFAQDTCGDVTPNYKWDTEKNWVRGKYKDDFKSAQYNGRLQYEQAKKLFEQASKQDALRINIDYIFRFVDFSNIAIDPQFVNGQGGLQTVPPAIGFDMLKGTKEGPGIVNPFISELFAKAGGLLSDIVKAVEKGIVAPRSEPKVQAEINMKYAMQGNKNIVIEAGKSRLLGAKHMHKFFLPGAIDPFINSLKSADRVGAAFGKPWMPYILPLQIFLVGSIAIVGIPAEMTTVAGRRIRETVLRVLKHRGIRHIMLSTYSNGYSGYVTTPEEYDCQCYEGGHTLYGKWTLPAYQTQLHELALELLKPKKQRTPQSKLQPVILKEDEIWYGE